MKKKKNTFTPNVIATPFMIASMWKQPRSPPTDEWIKKSWYLYTMKYCLVMKRNEIEPVVVMWMNLESVKKGKPVESYCTTHGAQISVMCQPREVG